MIVQIRVRENTGEYRAAIPGEFAVAALEEIHRKSDVYNRWLWTRDWIARWCLIKAEEVSGSPVEADKWIRRYQAIRGIE